MHEHGKKRGEILTSTGAFADVRTAPFLLAVSACSAEQLTLQLDASPGDLVVVVSGQGSAARTVYVESLEDLPFRVQTLEDAGWAAGFRVPKDTISGPEAAAIAGAHGFAQGTPPPSGTGDCGRCPIVPDHAPWVLHGGEACPIPEFAEAAINLGSSTIDAEVAESLARDFARIGIPGACPCPDRSARNAEELSVSLLRGAADIDPVELRIGPNGRFFGLTETHYFSGDVQGVDTTRALDRIPARIFDVLALEDETVISGSELTDRETPVWMYRMAQDGRLSPFELRGIERLNSIVYLELGADRLITLGRADLAPAAATCLPTASGADCRLASISSTSPCRAELVTRRPSHAALIGHDEYIGLSHGADGILGRADDTRLRCLNFQPTLADLANDVEPQIASIASQSRTLVGCATIAGGAIVFRAAIPAFPADPDERVLAPTTILARGDTCGAVFQDPVRRWLVASMDGVAYTVDGVGEERSAPIGESYPGLSARSRVDVHASGWFVAMEPDGKISIRPPNAVDPTVVAEPETVYRVAVSGPPGLFVFEQHRVIDYSQGSQGSATLLALPATPTAATWFDGAWLVATLDGTLQRVEVDGTLGSTTQFPLESNDVVRSIDTLDEQAVLLRTQKGALAVIEGREVRDLTSSKVWVTATAAMGVGWAATTREIARIRKGVEGWTVELDWGDRLAGPEFNEPHRIAPPGWELAHAFCSDRVAFQASEDLDAAVGPSMTTSLSVWITKQREERLELQAFAGFDGAARGAPASVETGAALVGDLDTSLVIFSGQPGLSASISRRGIPVARLPFHAPTSAAKVGSRALVIGAGRGVLFEER